MSDYSLQVPKAAPLTLWDGTNPEVIIQMVTKAPVVSEWSCGSCCCFQVLQDLKQVTHSGSSMLLPRFARTEAGPTFDV